MNLRESVEHLMNLTLSVAAELYSYKCGMIKDVTGLNKIKEFLAWYKENFVGDFAFNSFLGSSLIQPCSELIGDSRWARSYMGCKALFEKHIIRNLQSVLDGMKIIDLPIPLETYFLEVCKRSRADLDTLELTD